MSDPRIVVNVRSILSTDIEQLERVEDSKLTIDDDEQTKMGVVYTTLAAGSSYAAVNLPNSIARIGFLKIETDAPILCRLNGVGEIPITPIITPAIAPGAPVPGPSVIPLVQKGFLVLRSGVSADSPATNLTTVELRCPGSTAASVKITVAGE